MANELEPAVIKDNVLVEASDKEKDTMKLVSGFIMSVIVAEIVRLVNNSHQQNQDFQVNIC